jgi:hypothetical protein
MEEVLCMRLPILVEVIAYAPTAYYHCTHCEVSWREMGAGNNIHKEQLNSSLPQDLAQDYQQISDWVREILKLHCDQVVVKVIDAASLEGFIKTIRYGLRRYPAVVVNQKTRFINEALFSAGEEIKRLLTAEQPFQVQ